MSVIVTGTQFQQFQTNGQFPRYMEKGSIPYATERSLLLFCNYSFTGLHGCGRTNDMVQIKAIHNVCRKRRCSPRPRSPCVIKFIYSILLLQICLWLWNTSNQICLTMWTLNAHQKYTVPWFYLHEHKQENTSPWILRKKFIFEAFPWGIIDWWGWFVKICIFLCCKKFVIKLRNFLWSHSYYSKSLK